MRTRYIQIDGRLHEIGSDFRQEVPADVAHNIVSDIEPYQSMATGEMIKSRREHREHLKRHNVIELGNEKMVARPTGIPQEYREDRKKVVAALVDKYGEDRIRRDARELGEHLKWNSRK